MATFDELFEEIILQEGEALTDDPDDRGGVTKFGISKEANPDIDVENLTLEDAKKIYKERYWDKFKIGNMPEQFRRDVFVNVVNSGSAFIEDMQSSLGVSVDGIVGKQTLGALKKQKGSNLSNAMFDAQVSRYIRLAKEDPSQRKYLNGWMNRVVGAEPGSVFAKSKIDLRDMKLSEIKSVVDKQYTEKQVFTPDAAPQNRFEDLATGFLENINAYISKTVQRPQSGSQPTSEESMAADKEEPQFTEQEQALIDASLSYTEETEDAKPADETEFTPAEIRLIERATGMPIEKGEEEVKRKAQGTVETEEPVRVESTGERDDSKDPIYGLF